MSVASLVISLALAPSSPSPGFELSLGPVFAEAVTATTSSRPSAALGARAGILAILEATGRAEELDDDEGAIDDAEGEADGPLDDLGVSPTGTATVATSTHTAAIDDTTLARLFREDRGSLGSIAIGVHDAGRLINAEPFPAGPSWTIVDPPNTYATRETIAYMLAALREVVRHHPDAPPLRINHISAKEGGYLPPHSTHQLGRDVDLGFYHRTTTDARGRVNTRTFDPVRNWALVRALITETDIELILVDRRIQKVLYDHALSIGEDRAWLDSIFRSGRSSIVQHARRHRDHFHARFYNPRAQELGRRVQPLLGQDESVPQLVRHRIRNGDSLGHIARKYGVAISALKRANRMRSDFIRAGRVLVIPVRGRCVHCPTAPVVVVPPRRLPPDRIVAEPSPSL